MMVRGGGLGLGCRVPCAVYRVPCAVCRVEDGGLELECRVHVFVACMGVRMYLIVPCACISLCRAHVSHCAVRMYLIAWDHHLPLKRKSSPVL